jgi:ubiquinone/menaquinone biosynthesis C-methylase UbiE
MSDKIYVHGYSPAEQERLYEQARFLAPSVFQNIDFSQCEDLLEVGCGVGAETEIILEKFPRLKITAVDVSKESLLQAEQRLKKYAGRVSFVLASGEHLPFNDASFDAVFVCWVLEHVQSPTALLSEANRLLKDGGKIICTEVQNSSLYLYPDSPHIQKYWNALNTLQMSSGDPFVGLKLGNLLQQSGYRQITLRSLLHHYDQRTPERLKAMLSYWKTLMLSAKDQLLSASKINEQDVLNMLADYEQLQESAQGVFHYAAVQAEAFK